MAAPNAAFTQTLSAATHRYLTEGEFVDNIFKANKYLGLLKAFDAYDPADGGASLVVPLQYATNPTVKSAAAYDTIVLQETEESTVAQYDWTSIVGAVVLSKMDIGKNGGEAQIINLVQARINSLEMTTQQKMNEQLFAGNSSIATDLLGLTQLVASGSVGGIDGATNAFWQSFQHSSGTALSESSMELAFLQASNNIQPPHVGLTTLTLYQKYMDLVRAKGSVNIPDTRLADLGWDQASFKGKPLVWDADCASGDVYFLNFNYLKLFYHKDFNFDISPQIELQSQNVFCWKVFWMGQHAISNRRMCGRLLGRTA